MDKKQRKIDKISSTILAAFILMSGTHFVCRYDVGALIDTMFQKVSAETFLPEVSNNPTVAASESTIGPNEPTTTVATISIARNPFAVPAGALPVPVTYVPMPSTGTNMKMNSSTPQTAPATLSHPVLQGIVQSGNKSLAIIDYMGTSKAYSVGQDVGGGYTLESIGARSVSLSGEEISMGGNG
jgi:hypothetical protein